MEVILSLITEYLREVIETVFSLVGEKKTKEIQGGVAGRPVTEDVKIGIDVICEEIFKKLLKRFGLRVKVYSEHGVYGSRSPRYFCAIDPFDGSGLYLRDFEFEWYSVLTFFDLKGNPLAGGTADILKKRIYLADVQKKKCFLFDEKNQKHILTRPRKNGINGQIRIAAYLMDAGYLLPWIERMKSLLEKFPKVWIWPNGGAGIYHMIADGRVHAYIMFSEPWTEINPGLAFAKASNFPVVSVNDDGTWENCKFVPGKQLERVPFFIAAATEQLVHLIIEEIQ